MASKLLDPESNDTTPVFLRTVYDEISKPTALDWRKHRVLMIRLFKEKGLVGHEFLILDVFDNTTLVRLLVERRPSRRKAGEPHHPWWNLPKVDFLVTDGDDVLKKLPHGFSPTDYHLVSTLTADADDAPTFATVCRIMWEVQQEAPNYTLLHRHCYWFTGTVIERVKRESRTSERQGEFTMRVKDGPGVKRRGNPGGILKHLKHVKKVYPESKAAQYVASQIKKQEEVEKDAEETAREQMQAAMKSAVTMAQAERQQSKEDMRRAVQPLLTTPEAYQRKKWADAMADVEQEFQKSQEDLQQAVHSLLGPPAVNHLDAHYWRSAFQNATTGSRT